MTFTRPMAFWSAALASFVVLIWLLHEILLPFVAGMVLGYLLDPLANRIERLGVGRLAAAMLIIGLSGFAIIFLLILMAPILIGQLAAFVEQLPDYVSRLHALVTDPNRPWLTRILGASLGEQDLSDATKQASTGALLFLHSLMAGGHALVSAFWLLVITPVVAFYMVYDWQRIIATVDGWLPRTYADTIRTLAKEIDSAIAGFIRGQTGICLIIASLYAVGLTMLGLNYGLLIGAVAGFLSFIPYVGSLTGLLLAVGVALAQFWPDAISILSVIGVCIVCQFLEDYVLAPTLVGSIIGLHPLWLMFSLFAFAYLFGFVGLLLAVPLASAFAVLIRFALKQYLASSLYSGKELR
ncbi:MAG TPA: AI-2E family transporter [Xanthobacteraceae bacterium]|nr:AI-2E family transporter [Xanthobacteraceae bacterium]